MLWELNLNAPGQLQESALRKLMISNVINRFHKGQLIGKKRIIYKNRNAQKN